MHRVEWRKLFDVDSSYSDSRWAELYPEKVDELNDFICQYYSSVVSGVIDYLQGRKDKISDQEVFRLIDKEYYDSHPSEKEYYQRSSRYNTKGYMPYGEEYGYVSARSYDKDWGPIIFSDGTEVPEGTLMFM